MTTPRLFDQVRAAIRVRHYSRRTEVTYVHWIRRFILFHAKRHPREMGEREVTAFLTYLAVNKNVAASTQNQALAAILFPRLKATEELFPARLTHKIYAATSTYEDRLTGLGIS